MFFNPFSFSTGVSRVSFTGVSLDGLNLMWGENPDYLPAEFLTYAPEFGGLVESGDQYEALFNIFAVVASTELSEERFGNDIWKYVMALYIAHKLTIKFRVITGIPDAVTDPEVRASLLAAQEVFPIASEQVGGVQRSYDVGATLSKGYDGGDWNRTSYGQELVGYLRKYSVGAWIVGV